MWVGPRGFPVMLSPKRKCSHLPTVSSETTTLRNECGLYYSQNQWCKMALSGGPMAFPGYLRGGFDAVSDLPKACSIDTCA